MTLATLTGHEVLTYGYYATIMDNGKTAFRSVSVTPPPPPKKVVADFPGPAKHSGWARRIQDIGDEFGQPIEISRLQPEVSY